MEGYSVKIREASRDLTAKEKIALKDYSNATALDSALDDIDVLTITPVAYVVLDVHNEKSKQDKDYVKYLIIDNAGNKFVTGSESFFTSFKDIFDTMSAEAPGEEYSIDVLTITPVAYVVLDVHNEKSKQDKDYVKYLIIDNAGNKFVTGSESFFTSFKDIFDTMSEEAPGEEYSIDVLKKPSQNYKGKSFITCALAL